MLATFAIVAKGARPVGRLVGENTTRPSLARACDVKCRRGRVCRRCANSISSSDSKSLVDEFQNVRLGARATRQRRLDEQLVADTLVRKGTLESLEGHIAARSRDAAR